MFWVPARTQIAVKLLNRVIILWKHYNISERYYFGMRKHIEVEDGGREGGVQFFAVHFFDEASLSKTLASLKKLQGS